MPTLCDKRGSIDTVSVYLTSSINKQIKKESNLNMPLQPFGNANKFSISSEVCIRDNLEAVKWKL
jgi:hypothetical protein